MSMVILNATVGVILKCFMVATPIFTIFHQIDFFLHNSIDGITFKLEKAIRTCTSDSFCSTIETIGRNFFLLNLTIPFFFFYKFDIRFKECFLNFINVLKMKLKKT